MADVASTPLRAAVEPAVRDDPGADAGPDLDDHDVVVAGGHARAPLAECEQVHVVVDPDRRAVPGGEPLADRIAVPARHDRWRDGPAGPELDRTRHADPDAPQSTGHALGRREQEVEQRVDAIEPGLGSVLDARGLVVMAEDPAVEGGERDVDAGRTEVGDEQVAGRGPECELARRTAARAWPDRALRHQPAVDQFADAAGDDRPPEPGALDELGTRPRAPEPDLVQDGHEIVEHFVGQRGRRRLRSGRRSRRG